MRTSFRLVLIAALAATAIALPLQPPAAYAATSTVTITVNPGSSVGISVSPTSTSFNADVTTPGSNWTFYTARPYFPSGWIVAFVYTPSGNPGCMVASVVAFKASNWTLTAYVSQSPATPPIAVALAPAGTGSTCATPSSPGTVLSTTSGSPTTLASNKGNLVLNYYLVVQPTDTVTSPVTLTVTFTAQ